MDITVEDLTKKYGAQKAVDAISFHVKTGEVLGFLGPNGAGKTTTMKIITCLMAPNKGEVRVGDYSVNSQPEEVKKLIGYLPENNPLYLDMPVIDYLTYTAALQGVPKNKIKPRIAEMVRLCGARLESQKLGRLLSDFANLLV